MTRVRAIPIVLVVMALEISLSVTGTAFPIKPKLSDIIKEAQKPQVHYPAARAGWNGPEEKTAVPRPNAVYDQMRYDMSAEGARAQLMRAAKPDWRVLIVLATVVVFWRYMLDRSRGKTIRNDNVITMPNPAVKDRAA